MEVVASQSFTLLVDLLVVATKDAFKNTRDFDVPLAELGHVTLKVTEGGPEATEHDVDLV
jgi:hypothetical protein